MKGIVVGHIDWKNVAERINDHYEFYDVALELGYEYAKNYPYYEAPLSYEFAGMPTFQEIYRDIESRVGRPIPDEVYEFLLDEWETGYDNYWETQGKVNNL